MTDSLIQAAERFNIATEQSAGPAGAPDLQVWSRWPKHRLEIAHDLLGRVLSSEKSVGVVAVGPDLWRAHDESWSFTGTFEEAIAALALYVSEQGRRQDSRSPRQRNNRLMA